MLHRTDPQNDAGHVGDDWPFWPKSPFPEILEPDLSTCLVEPEGHATGSLPQEVLYDDPDNVSYNSRFDIDDVFGLSWPPIHGDGHQQSNTRSEPVMDATGLLANDITPETLSLETISPRTISSGKVAGPSPSKHNSTLEIVQYEHSSCQQKTGMKRKRGDESFTKRKTRALPQRSDVLRLDKAPRTSIRKDANGKVAGAMTVFGLGQVVRAPLSIELQLATTNTRHIGACEICRSRRQRCTWSEDIYQPCKRCKKMVLSDFYVRRKLNLSQPLCFRVSILDLRLHRRGPTIYDDLHLWVNAKKDLIKYDPFNVTRTLYLTQGFGEKTPLTLAVSHFEPQPGDRTAYFWTDSSGVFRSMQMPPYFISDMQAARESICRFLRDARSIYIETLLSDTKPVIRQTFQTALYFNAFKESRLISNALDVWVAARFIESHWRVFWGFEGLGFEPPDEPGHPYAGFTPVTPMIDTQLDDLVIRDLLVPLTTQFLKRLDDKINEQRRENWLEIYLAMFVMMSNIGWIVKDMIAMTTWKGLKPGTRGGTLTQGYMHACKVMLAYFHFACGGSHAFSLPPDTIGASGLSRINMTPDELVYLKTLQQEVFLQNPDISRWKELSMYEDDGYWCYQMLCKDWAGDILHAGEIDDFTENDFLSSSAT